MKILKTANYEKVAQVKNVLDGRSNQSARNAIYKIVEPYTKGIFSDKYWTPIHSIWKNLTAKGVDWEITDTRYDKDNNGNPSSKRWFFKINFINNRNKQVELPGTITAAGAGTVADPLSRYDVTFVI